MNHEIKTDKQGGYTFDSMVKQTEAVTLKGYKVMKNVPTMIHLAVEGEHGGVDYGVGFVPEVESMSNNEVIEKLGNTIASDGKVVKAVGVVCEAYMSKRTDMRPSLDPKRKEVIALAFGDNNGNKKLLLYSAKKGTATKLKGMSGVQFQGLVDSFWKGYTAKPSIVGKVQPNLA